MLCNLAIQHPIRNRRLLSLAQVIRLEHEIRAIQRQKRRKYKSETEREAHCLEFVLLALPLILLCL